MPSRRAAPGSLLQPTWETGRGSPAIWLLRKQLTKGCAVERLLACFAAAGRAITKKTQCVMAP